MTTTPAPVSTIDSAVRAVLATGTRPKRAGALSATLTFGWRALLKIKHLPEQLLDATAFPIMFTLMFTYLFGGAIAGSTGAYLQFLLPGILVQTVVMLTMYTGTALNTDISKGVFDRFRSLPIWRPAVIVGALLGDMVRYTLASVVLIVLGLILGYRPEGGLGGMLLSVPLLLVFSFSVSWIWTMFGLILRTASSITGLSMMIMMPLTFASNIFVNPETMPGWLQAFVSVNPVSHLTTAVRGLMAGTVTTGQLGMVLLVSALITLVFAPITMRLFRTVK